MDVGESIALSFALFCNPPPPLPPIQPLVKAPPFKLSLSNLLLYDAQENGPFLRLSVGVCVTTYII